MKPEPLKGKLQRDSGFWKEDIKSAFEWLQAFLDKKIEQKRKHLDKCKTRTEKLIMIASMTELEDFRPKIDEAFEDVTKEEE